MDELDLGMQPHCPTCGTVLRDVKGGYVCIECNLAHVGDVRSG